MDRSLHSASKRFSLDMGTAVLLPMVVLLLMIIVPFWVSRDEESGRTDGE